ncbi:response regulator transcription factor [Vibrio profundi]|uniref:helix-turn-helix transcriptional regulator n=1 Tax=Vibrio profundi TaxID=1774960 RepID=UPI0037362237
MLNRTIQILSDCPPTKFEENLEKLMQDSMDKLDIDRLTIYPNSKVALLEKRSISTTIGKFPPLRFNEFARENYADYLMTATQTEGWRIYDHLDLKYSSIFPLRHLHSEGVIRHGVTPLQLFGTNWGLLSVSQFRKCSAIPDDTTLTLLKNLALLWLNFWQHFSLRKSVGLDEERYSRLLLLSSRQREILEHMADGKTAKQSAEILKISTRTVESHKYRMLKILNLDNSNSLIKFALQNNLVPKD